MPVSSVGPLQVPARLHRVEDDGEVSLVLWQGGREVWREVVTSKRQSFACMDSLTLAPGADGWAQITVHEAVLPRPGEAVQRPGPPLELVFRRGGDGIWTRAE